ncbi:MAG: type II toxin-antitoxin system VapC family toxin [Bryobacteraceae bacterium]
MSRWNDDPSPLRRHGFEMRPTLYLETTIPSYLVSRPSRDLIIAAHQQVTMEWWSTRRSAFDIFVSQLVLDEARAGDSEAAGARLQAIKGLPLLDITGEVGLLLGRMMSSGVIPPKAAADVAHIAIAAAHGLDFLMTWNCVHLANAVIAKAVARVCRDLGFECPVICTPEELMGE